MHREMLIIGNRDEYEPCIERCFLFADYLEGLNVTEPFAFFWNTAHNGRRDYNPPQKEYILGLIAAIAALSSCEGLPNTSNDTSAIS
jgi:hypothetical protein